MTEQKRHRDTSRYPENPEKTGRDQDGRFMPGSSGNPQGRPKRPPDPLRARLAEAAPQLLENLLAAAAEGDVSAARVLLDRCLPALRPVESAQVPDLPQEGLTAQASAIVDLTASGELAAGTAATLLAGLASVARIREAEELEARIAALEAQLARP